jgi:hypothetical protein
VQQSTGLQRCGSADEGAFPHEDANVRWRDTTAIIGWWGGRGSPRDKITRDALTSLLNKLNRGTLSGISIESHDLLPPSNIFGLLLLIQCSYFSLLLLVYGARGSVVIKALLYEPEGRGFETRRGD